MSLGGEGRIWVMNDDDDDGERDAGIRRTFCSSSLFRRFFFLVLGYR